MAMAGRFGTRKNNRLAQTDFQYANDLHAELKKLLTVHQNELGMELPDNYPKTIQYPGVGSNADQRGSNLMDYTLWLTRTTVTALNVADKQLGFIYNIETVPRKPNSLYYVSVCYIGYAPLKTVSGDYLACLVWILQMLNKSLDLKKRKSMQHG